MKKMLLLATMMILQMKAHALPQEGHGGKVWDCTDKAGNRTIELLDFDRARKWWKLTTDLGPSTTVEGKVKYVLNRLAKFEPGKADAYLVAFKKFQSRSMELEDYTLFDIHDHYEVGRPNHCKLKVVINQSHEMPAVYRNPHTKDIRFFINKDLWNELDTTQQAGLILHEIIYENAIQVGHNTSDASIYTNALITSKDFESYNFNQWLDTLRQANMPFIQDGINLDSHYLVLDSTTNIVLLSKAIGSPFSGPYREKDSLKVYGSCIKDVFINSQLYHEGVLFHSNGKLKCARIIGKLENYPEMNFKGETHLSPEGDIVSTQMVDGAISLQNLKLSVFGPTSFYPKNKLSKVAIGNSENDTKILSFLINGVWAKKVFKKETPAASISFDSKGRMIDFPIDKTDIPVMGGTLSFHGQVKVNNANQMIRGIIAEPKEIVINGDAVKFKLNQEIFLSNSQMLNGANILPKIDDRTEHYIKVTLSSDKKQFNFKLCSLAKEDECTQIGKREFYPKKDIFRHLNVDEVQMQSRFVTFLEQNAVAFGTSTAAAFIGSGAGVGIAIGQSVTVTILMGVIGGPLVGTIAFAVGIGAYHGADAIWGDDLRHARPFRNMLKRGNFNIIASHPIYQTVASFERELNKL